MASAVPRKCSVSVTAIKPDRENKTPTRHVSRSEVNCTTTLPPFLKSVANNAYPTLQAIDNARAERHIGMRSGGGGRLMKPP
jgi:hypothetical protein